jgi:23S rRNA G2445 N2-methylase RlmL
MKNQYFATCPRGLEALLANELKASNAKEIKPGKIIGTGELFDAFDGEHSAVRSVKAEF